MQTNPNSDYTFYLAFDGHTLTAPIGMTTNIFGGAWSWVQYANVIDIDGTYTALNLTNYVSTLSFPPATDLARGNRTEIINRVKKYFEIFDVNVTDEISVFESTAKEKRYMSVITQRPTVEEYNTLLEDLSEESYFSYSYRRFLLGANGVLVRGRNGLSDVVFQNPVRINIGTYNPHGFTQTKQNQNQKFYGFGDVSKSWPSIVFTDKVNPAWMDLSESPKDRKLYHAVNDRQNLYGDTIERISQTIAHEIGHNFPFQGHFDGSGHDGNIDGNPMVGEDSYYIGHGNWGPIMGTPKFGTQLIQWSKGEYQGATNKIDDDIAVINKQIPLLKKPKKSMPALSYSREFSLQFETKYWDKTLGYNVRVLTKNDVEEIKENGKTKKIIKGLIGFPYDFDIIKILLPPGTYNFTINPLFDENKSTMLDPKLQILNCSCQESKVENNPSCNQNNLPSFYPTNIDENKMQCICFNDNFEPLKSSHTNDGFFTVSITENLNNRQIVYLKIQGDKNRTPVDGWSRYGSLGEYYLKITRNFQNIFSEDPSTFLSNNILPKSRCQEFDVCYSKTILYIEDESGGPQGNENEEHFIELSTVLNGEIVTQKFLVYGQPIDKDTDTDTPEYEGRLFLTVIIDGECKKQEFITGGYVES